MTNQHALETLLNQVVLPANVAIRAWQVADMPELTSLASAEGWTSLRDRPADSLLAWQHSWPALVAVAEQQVVGFVRAITDGAITFYVADLLVAPAWRGQGIGTALLRVCHLLYPSIRIDLLALPDAIAFYEAQGFRAFPGFRRSAQ
jgi:GNAT superfamily N-acetyltransferase